MRTILLIALALVALIAVQAQEFDQLAALAEPAAASGENNDVALAQLSSTTEATGPTGRRPTAAGNKRPKDKLDIALAAIKQDIMVRNRQLEEEKNWVGEVHKITEQYNKKVHRVEADIVKVRNEVKELFKKKKQVENLKIQRALEASSRMLLPIFPLSNKHSITSRASHKNSRRPSKRSRRPSTASTLNSPS